MPANPADDDHAKGRHEPLHQAGASGGGVGVPGFRWLAGEIGVSRGAVAQWEMVEGTSPSVENLIALAQRSGMAFEYLATGRGAKIHGAPMCVPEAESLHYHSLTSQQTQVLAMFDRLSPRQRAGLLDLLDGAGARASGRVR